MNAFSISPIVVERLGWVLVHSLWQFGLIAVLAAVVVRLLRRNSAAARYAVLCMAMLLIVVVPAATWMLLPAFSSGSLPDDLVRAFESPAGLGIDEGPGTEALFNATSTTSEMPEWDSPVPIAESIEPFEPRSETAQPVPASLESKLLWADWAKQLLRPWLVWIVAGWSVGVVLCSLRPLLGWYTLRRLRRVGVSSVSDEVLATLRRVSQRLGMRRAVRALHSTLAKVPIVVGYFRPVILLPVSLVTSIPASQLEAILAHELAHVRRHDFLANLLQTLTETVFFYHPAVWWLSSRLRAEREHCCDDLVVAALGNRVEYGRALLAIEELRGRESVLALGASDGRLLARVRRIVGFTTDSPAGSPWSAISVVVLSLVFIGAMSVLSWRSFAESQDMAKPTESDRLDEASGEVPVEPADATTRVDPGEWPMWGRSSHRNHVASGRLPTEWDLTTGLNVLWTAKLGTQSYSSPVVAGGKAFIGTNNGSGLDPRRPSDHDLSCLVCLDQTTGKLLWQFASEKLPAGRVHDWPGIGLCSTACVEGDRLWIVTNRCEVVCLDTNGFRDGENDGDFTAEADRTEIDADVVWKFDMFNKLGVRPLHQAVSSITVVDGVVLLNTSNGPDESYSKVPAPNAPNFLALDARTGSLIWRDNTSGESIITGGSSCSCSGTSPAVATIGGVTQVIFAGREGWLYGFDFADLKRGKTTRLWQFDCNPKTSKYLRSGHSTRNTLVASPVVVGDYVFIATGRNPEEGEGAGDLWCVDATKRGDISSELVFNNSHREGREPIPHKPLCACDPQQGDFTRPNPNSGAVWHYAGTDGNGDGELAFDETFHRSISSPAIHDGLLFIPDYSGLLHCIDARTGEGLWTTDLLAAVWSSCVIADRNVLIGDEDGDIMIFKAARTCQPVYGDDPPSIGSSIYSTPALVNDTLFLSTKEALVAIRDERQTTATGQASTDAVPPTDADAKLAWGEPTNGLRARAVPVLSSMSEDEIDPDQPVAKFALAEDVAFAVELENVSDKAVKLLDTRYGNSFGDSSGKANSNWFGQFLFTIDLFDSEGKLIERPKVEVVDLNTVLDGALVATLEPGKTHRFLLRPGKWLRAMTQRIEPGTYRAAVRYHGLPERVASRIKEYHADSPALEAVPRDIVTAPVPFEVSSFNGKPKASANKTDNEPRVELAWGEPTNGLRAAMSFAPPQDFYSHGEKPEVRLHVQNVSDLPTTLASLLWLSELEAKVANAEGEPVQVGRTWYTGWTLAARVTLQPQQSIVFNAGNVGLAITKERAGTFEDMTNRTLVAPAGKYTMQLQGRFGNSFTLKDGQGKLLAPLEGDWIGELKTGVTPFEITNESIECNIVDAVTGKPVAGTTVNFRFIKPKSGDTSEEIVAAVFWGPQAPSRIAFFIPDKVLARADRDEIEAQWGVGGHADYEDYAPAERIPLKQFFNEGTQAARETLHTVKLTPKKKGEDEPFEVAIKVVTTTGQPVAGAAVIPTGVNVTTGAYLQLESKWSPVSTTNSDGMARIVISREPFKVAHPLLSVDGKVPEVTSVWLQIEHPHYPTSTKGFDIASPTPLVLDEVATIEVRALRQNDPKLLRGIMPSLSRYSESKADWASIRQQSLKDGVLTIPRVDLTSKWASRWLRLVHATDDGPAWFSELIDLKPLKSPISLNLEMKPGVRIAGRLAESVPRPITNGRIQARVHPARTEGADSWAWEVATAIDGDGSFVLGSVPVDETLQLIAICDGWVSQRMTNDGLKHFAQETGFTSTVVPTGDVSPQLFRTSLPVVEPVIPMERTADCEVTVVNESGQPIADAKVWFSPQQQWFHDASSRQLGSTVDSLNALQSVFQSGVRSESRESGQMFIAKTNEHGIAHLTNLPGRISPTGPAPYWLIVTHDNFETLNEDVTDDARVGKLRLHPVELIPGQSSRATVRMTAVEQENAVNDARREESEPPTALLPADNKPDQETGITSLTVAKPDVPNRSNLTSGLIEFDIAEEGQVPDR